jgi:hypothetical protein
MRIPEVLFDLDFPGHYLRRLKSVSLSIPCVTGPYTGIHATLRLTRSLVRRAPTLAGDAEEERFEGGTSIAASTGQHDSGLFELSFRDERFLPFEGAGAIGTWTLSLPPDARLRPFDYETIADVVLHLHYTARDGGTAFKNEVGAKLNEELNLWLKTLTNTRTPITRLFSLRRDFPSQFHAFLHPKEGEAAHQAEVAISQRHFPHFLKEQRLQLLEPDESDGHGERSDPWQIRLILKPKEPGSYGAFDGLTVQLSADGVSTEVSLANLDMLEGVPVAEVYDREGSPIQTWAVRIARDQLLGLAEDPDLGLVITENREGQPTFRLDPDKIDDVLLLMRVELDPAPDGR